MAELVIYGAGGHAREMFQVLEDCIADGAKWHVIGFCDDARSPEPRVLCDLPVLAWDQWSAKARPQVLIAIGHPAARKRVARRLASEAAGFPTIIHPTVLRGRRIAWGAGGQVAQSAVLTVDITVGDFALINRGAQISHDCCLDDYATVGPLCSLSGATRIGSGADLGSSVTTIPRVSIGAASVVGAGSVVTEDLPPHVLAVGVPARIVRPLP